tara:strand:- start:255 stop:998 length:744 start_codon:yes stop_codon:yes gene_type:complete
MILISPAKKLTNQLAESKLNITKPVFSDEANLIASELSKLTSNNLSKLMNVSAEIGQINEQRYANWGKSRDSEKRAIFQFEGDVYKYLNPLDMNEDDLQYMNKRLRILSGIYGLLKPSDEMNPYRLEMGTKFQINGSKNLYQFWGDKIAKQLKTEFDSTYIYNLASDEYFLSVKQHLDVKKVLNFRFLTNKNGVLKVISFTAKRARGEMTRFLIKNRIEGINGVEEFNALGFRFSRFTDNQFEFIQD